MIKKFLFTLALVMPIFLTAQNIGIQKVDPTPFFPKVNQGERLKQIAKLTLNSSKQEQGCKLLIAIDGEKPYFEEIGTVASGSSVHDIQIYDIEYNKNISFSVIQNGTTVADTSIVWLPQKKWKVYYAAVSHQDLGFETYYQNIRRAVREGGLDIALDYCTRTDSWDDDSKFRWNVETSEPLIRWIAKQTPEKVDELAKRIKEGRIELAAIHNTISSQMAGYEALARSFYTPNRYVVDVLGIDPAKVSIINDVTGITRSWPLYSKEAQIPYLMHGSNYPNCLNDLFNVPVFYWDSPDNDTQNKVLCRTDSYYSPNKVGTWDVKGVNTLIDRHQKLNWPYDCILAYDSHDFAIPTLDNATNIKEWNSKYEYPRIRCSTISIFFDDVTAQADKSEILHTSKDAPDSWDDQDATDAELLGEARRANYQIPTAEKFSAIAMALTGSYPEESIFQAYNRIVMYHEHTNGAVSGGDHQYYETERQMHRTLVYEATEYADQALNSSVKRINSQIKTAANTIVIYNPLSWERDDIAFIDPSQLPSGNFAIIDTKTGLSVKTQEMSNGKIAIHVQNIPSLGYKSYAIKESSSSTAQPSELSTENICENKFYKIKLDNDKNIIAEIHDKILSADLIDKSSPYALGEYIYYDGYDKQWKKSKFTDIKYYKGTVADEIHIKQESYLTNGVNLTIYVYHDIKKIDFAMDLNKISNTEELVGSWNRDFLEAMFCAFPILVPNFEFNHEMAGAVMRPGEKELQFDASESAYYAIQHFADVSNSDMGVTLSTIECPLIEYGYPRPGYWNSAGRKPKEDIVKPNNSNMFLYLMNNFFSTNVSVDQPGPKNFTFALNSHQGDWKKGQAYKFGWESSHPLIATVTPSNPKGTLPSQKAFLTTDADNVICSTVKPAEANGSGYVLRFFELEGKPSEVNVKFYFTDKISKAYAVSLIENNLSELTVSDGNTVKFNINGHGIKTIRVVGTPAKTKSVNDLKAKPISDLQIALNWTPDKTKKISHYAVYRSHLPECEINRRNFIGSTQQANYIDQTKLNYGGWPDNILKPEQTYYYRVCAVDKFNNLTDLSNVTKCTTLSTNENNSQPNKVEGVYTVYVSPLAPENYINLWFYTNLEKDVDKYMIHRGESPNFTPNQDNYLGAVIPSQSSINYRGKYSHSELNRQMFNDKTAKINTRYYYKVCAVDNAGQQGEYSDPAEAIMEMIPIEVISTPIAVSRFEEFTGHINVEIKTTETNYDLYYTMDNTEPTLSSAKYSNSFLINNTTIIRVALYKKGEQHPTYTKSKLIKANNVVAQSSYATQWGPILAIDGNQDPAATWVSSPYGGLSKESPSDVWLGVMLPSKMLIKGVVFIGDNRDMMPIQEDFKIYTRLNNQMTLSAQMKTDGVKMPGKNRYKICFTQPTEADGILFYVPAADLPKSADPAQDGIVRVSELMLIMPDGIEINIKEKK